jgi:putative DNA methylase
MPNTKKLIEVALPLEAINAESAREKSIRHGHPSTLHLWWARRPLAAARAVIFSSLIDDPDQEGVPQALLDRIDSLPLEKYKLPEENSAIGEVRRGKLFEFIEKLGKWENSNNSEILKAAHELIHAATGGNPPALLDPFAGGGAIPLEA